MLRFSEPLRISDRPTEMARHLSVIRPTDFKRTVEGSWRVGDGSIDLYNQPFGSEWSVRELWSAPAVELDLPLLASVYDVGFHHGIAWTVEELPQVKSELRTIEGYWAGVPLSTDERAHFEERAGYLREAIQIAEQQAAVIVII